MTARVHSRWMRTFRLLPSSHDALADLVEIFAHAALSRHVQGATASDATSMSSVTTIRGIRRTMLPPRIDFPAPERAASVTCHPRARPMPAPSSRHMRFHVANGVERRPEAGSARPPARRLLGSARTARPGLGRLEAAYRHPLRVAPVATAGSRWRDHLGPLPTRPGPTPISARSRRVNARGT
jgi:hypothetical protein